ncbi:hypothetical protein GCM10022221_69580 [Actinocorallia aurea]
MHELPNELLLSGVLGVDEFEQGHGPRERRPQSLAATASPARRSGSLTVSGTAPDTRLAVLPANSPVRSSAVLA